MPYPFKLAVLLGKLCRGGYGPIRKEGVEYRCRCPAHEDRGPSLYIGVTDSKILVNCKAEWACQAICDSLDHAVADLNFEPDEQWVEIGDNYNITSTSAAGAEQARRPESTLHDAATADPQPDEATLRNNIYKGLLAPLELSLGVLLPELCPGLAVPTFVVQHMPAVFPEFTRSLADLLARQAGRPVVEARDGDEAAPGTVYVAPTDRHLLLRAGSGRRIVTALNAQPKENGFRPSADVLFRSAAAALGGEAVAVVLTGMSCDRVADGTAGLRPLKRAGGCVIAQDEASSVVWGMPGSVVAAGLADAVLPLYEIAAAVRALVANRGGG